MVDGHVLAPSATAGPADLEHHPFLARLAESPFSPPDPEGIDRAELRALERRGLVVESHDLWFSAAALDRAARIVAGLLARSPEGVPVSAIREALGTTRKYTLPLVAWLDANGVTRRRGDLRIAGPRLPDPA